MKGIRLQVGRPLLAANIRRGAAALLGCCAILVVALGILFAHQSRADWFDRAIDAPVVTWFSRHPFLAFRLAFLGSLVPSAALSGAIAIACLLAGRLNGCVLALVAVPVAVGLDERLLKPLFHRTHAGNLVYPSGHTTAVFAIAATVTLLLLPPRPGHAKAVQIAIPAAACVPGCIVAAALIGMQWHYFTDTVAGAAVGIGTVCGLALVLDLPTARSLLARASRRPRAEAPTVAK